MQSGTALHSLQQASALPPCKPVFLRSWPGRSVPSCSEKPLHCGSRSAAAATPSAGTDDDPGLATGAIPGAGAGDSGGLATGAPPCAGAGDGAGLATGAAPCAGLATGAAPCAGAGAGLATGCIPCCDGGALGAAPCVLTGEAGVGYAACSAAAKADPCTGSACDWATIDGGGDLKRKATGWLNLASAQSRFEDVRAQRVSVALPGVQVKHQLLLLGYIFNVVQEKLGGGRDPRPKEQHAAQDGQRRA